jgi:hypothetical protein
MERKRLIQELKNKGFGVFHFALLRKGMSK